MDVLNGFHEIGGSVKEGKLVVAVYGAGRVGATIAAAWLRAGAKVILVDIDPKRIGVISSGGDLFPDEPKVDETFRSGFRAGRFAVTTSPSQAASASDVNIVAVPVGLKAGRPDLSSVREAFSAIAERMQRGCLNVLETSVPPGTTRKVVLPILLRREGFEVERDFGLAYSPERIFEGRSLQDLEENYVKVAGGVGPKSTRAVVELYSLVAKKGVLTMSTLEAAETEKLFEGVYRDVNIALANELAMVCERTGVDYWEVMKAANSQPFCHLHRPGPGVGGACIPVYPVFVMDAAKEAGARVPLTSTARELNLSMPKHVASLAVSLLGKEERKVALLGLAFRGNVNDDRLSPSYELLKELKKLGCDVVAHDPFVRRESAEGFAVVADLKRVLKGRKLALVATDHEEYSKLSYEELKEWAGGDLLVYDGRGVLDWSKFPRDRLVRLGVPYRPS